MSQLTLISTSTCANCGEATELPARFCGGCGIPLAAAQSAAPAPSPFLMGENATRGEYAPYCEMSAGSPSGWVNQGVPTFARFAKQQSADALNELHQELAKHLVLIARERLFLYFHWATFVVINLFGLWMALKCYYEFIGDDMSKLMIASTPFLFINSVALCCLVPIKGTRKEIARLKERMSYIRFKIEYGHLI